MTGIEFDTSKYSTQMAKAQEILKDAFSVGSLRDSQISLNCLLKELRVGRPSPSALDHVQVSVYGDKSPLKSIAQVSVRSAQVLAVRNDKLPS